MPSILEDLAVFEKQGLIEVPVKAEQAIDTSFVDWAVQQLGPYKKSQ